MNSPCGGINVVPPLSSAFVVPLSEIFHPSILTVSAERLNPSIHSGASPVGAAMISLMTILFVPAPIINVKINRLFVCSSSSLYITSAAMRQSPCGCRGMVILNSIESFRSIAGRTDVIKCSFSARRESRSRSSETRMTAFEIFSLPALRIVMMMVRSSPALGRIGTDTILCTAASNCLGVTELILPGVPPSGSADVLQFVLTADPSAVSIRSNERPTAPPHEAR